MQFTHLIKYHGGRKKQKRDTKSFSTLYNRQTRISDIHRSENQYMIQCQNSYSTFGIDTL